MNIFTPGQNGSFATEIPCHVRFHPDSYQTADIAGGPFRAKGGRRLTDDIRPRRLAQRPNLT
jgi:hypothetical protein